MGMGPLRHQEHRGARTHSTGPKHTEKKKAAAPPSPRGHEPEPRFMKRVNCPTSSRRPAQSKSAADMPPPIIKIMPRAPGAPSPDPVVCGARKEKEVISSVVLAPHPCQRSAFPTAVLDTVSPRSDQGYINEMWCAWWTSSPHHAFVRLHHRIELSLFIIPRMISFLLPVREGRSLGIPTRLGGKHTRFLHVRGSKHVRRGRATGTCLDCCSY